MNETNNKRDVKVKKKIILVWENLVPRIILTILNVAFILPIVIGANIEVFSDYHNYAKTIGPLKERKEIEVQYLGNQTFRSMTRGNEFKYKIPEYKLLGVKKGDLIKIEGIREYDTLTEAEQRMLDNTDIISPGTRIFTATIGGLIIEAILLLLFLCAWEGESDVFIKYENDYYSGELNKRAKAVLDIICFSPILIFLGLDIINLIIFLII